VFRGDRGDKNTCFGYFFFPGQLIGVGDGPISAPHRLFSFSGAFGPCFEKKKKRGPPWGDPGREDVGF